MLGFFFAVPISNSILCEITYTEDLQIIINETFRIDKYKYARRYLINYLGESKNEKKNYYLQNLKTSLEWAVEK